MREIYRHPPRITETGSGLFIMTSFFACTVVSAAVLLSCSCALDVAFSPSAWVNVGDNVRLECLGGESSSNITWTFQGKTFVVCKKWNTPVPAVPNVICRQVYQLFLKNTTKASEGLYGCETAAERSKKKRLRVHLSVTPTTTFAGKSSVTSLVTPFSSLTVTTTNTSNSSLSVVSANNSTANLSVVASLITTVTMRNSDNTYSPNFMVTRPVDMSALTNYLTVQPDPDIVGDDEGHIVIVFLIVIAVLVVFIIFCLYFTRRRKQFLLQTVHNFHVENCENVNAGPGNQQNVYNL